MRRDALDRAIKSVHLKTSKFFFQNCSKCGDDVKGEQMWWFREYFSGLGYPPCSWKTWTCRRCAPMMSDLFKAYPACFKDLDVSCLEEEERQYHTQPKEEG